MTTCGYFFPHAQEVKGNLGDQLGGPGTPAKTLGEPEGPPEIFPRVQPCSPIVECGSAFFEDISKGMQILGN